MGPGHAGAGRTRGVGIVKGRHRERARVAWLRLHHGRILLPVESRLSRGHSSLQWTRETHVVGGGSSSIVHGSNEETYQPLAVEQRRAAARRDSPLAEAEHMVDLLGQLGGVLVLRHEPQAALFVHFVCTPSGILESKTSNSA
ncbi:hypothetical protein EYF80_034551 [Liparis tanakae]|uniref:Uncharacterized protein n=1 Tax=Liparis tanakae TaxID=230148 RepID=A0A4Z2GNH7_9TELE|nr:hypothetical protein EYF80_034551 [Liparis tanakae]